MEVEEIRQTLVDILSAKTPPLRTKGNSPNGQVFEGTKPALQGNQKVDGYYFASIVPKPKDCRLYFFPIYTHVDQFSLSPELKKQLKGKSCFHIKKLTPELKEEITEMIDLGVQIYLKEELI
jgi:hypothetical protein